MLRDLLQLLTFPIVWMILIFIAVIVVSYRISNKVTPKNYYYDPGTFRSHKRYTSNGRSSQGESSRITHGDVGMVILIDEVLDDQDEM